VISVPASYPIKVFFSASVPLKASPALVPAVVFPCASELTPPAATSAQVNPPVLPD